ncbi:radical SAM protein [[Clostridium] dakarense]|uniref:radical SAM protein n=1 Tax=Faecalimicrobium dakarense TaxID=1301100 RepID=UPI0004AD76CB|nr:radical SAM protein [[Clostridium] dakarense]
MIRLSLGSAIELGLLNKASLIPPTTAYIMIGDKCSNKCAFCSQSAESSTRKDKLSRVIWPEYSKEEILSALKSYKGKYIKRICIQSMYSDEAHMEVEEFISFIKDEINFPISLSAKLESDKDIEKFFKCGVDKIGIAIDACNKELYENIKGNNYKEKLELITNMSRKYEGKISTHIIVGLGETHKDIHDLYTYLRDNKVTVSLFAFTPVKGTKMESISQPNIESYRRVQLMTYMIDRGYSNECFKFENGYLTHIELDEAIKDDINEGYPFEIRGCKNCNRPYYNERPGSTIYNYSRSLNEEEIKLAVKELNLA